MELKESFLSREDIYRGRIVKMHVDRVLLPNGHETKREVVEHPGGVGIVAIDDDGCVLTVRQYRYVFGTELEEIPAGKLERGEEPSACAVRELREEAGAVCSSLTPLGMLLPSPGVYGEKLYLFLAEGLSFGQQQLDTDEFVNVYRTPFAQMVRRVLSGDLTDGKTVAGILKVHALRAGGISY